MGAGGTVVLGGVGGGIVVTAGGLGVAPVLGRARVMVGAAEVGVGAMVLDWTGAGASTGTAVPTVVMLLGVLVIVEVDADTAGTAAGALTGASPAGLAHESPPAGLDAPMSASSGSAANTARRFSSLRATRASPPPSPARRRTPKTKIAVRPPAEMLQICTDPLR